MRQSSIAVPSGATLRPTRCTRPSRLVTVPAFSPHSVHGRNTSARCVDSDSNPSTAMIVSTASIAAASESWRRGSRRPDRHRGARAHGSCRRPRRAGSPRRRARGSVGTPPHAVGEPRAARVERRAPGQEAGREARVERAVHVAAPQRREEAHVVHVARARPPRRPPNPRLAATIAAPDDDHDRTRSALGDARDLVVHVRGDAARPAPCGRRRPRAPRARARPARGRRAAPRARATARRRRKKRTGTSSSQVVIEHARSRRAVEIGDLGAVHARARSRPGGRRRAARRRCRCRSRPWRAPTTRTRPRSCRARRRAPRSTPAPCSSLAFSIASAAAVERVGPRHLAPGRRRRGSAARAAGSRSAPTRGRSDPCRRASRG